MRYLTLDDNGIAMCDSRLSGFVERDNMFLIDDDIEIILGNKYDSKGNLLEVMNNSEQINIKEKTIEERLIQLEDLIVFGLNIPTR